MGRLTATTGVLLLALTGSGGAAAQDASPDPAAPSQVPASPAASGVPDATPSRLRKASVPVTGPGMLVFDLIEGGPGYIAVGGGTPTGLDHHALIWVSDDGATWQSVPLFGEAASGTIRGVAALPGGGYVAAGHDFEPQTERPDMVHLLTWVSADGISWSRGPADASFPGSMALAATSTPDGVALAGCSAGFHCDVGRVWTTTDGQTWAMEDGIAMAPYSIAASDSGELVIGGEDDAYDLVNGQAAVASSGDDWTIHVLGTGDSQVSGLTRAGDGFAATGYLVEPAGEVLGSMMASSSDGTDWTITEPKQLKHGTVTAGIDAAGDLVVVSGSRYDARKDRTAPIVLWSRASEELQRIPLPRRLDRKTFGTTGVRLRDDGTMAFVLGTEQNRPAIWYSVIE